MQTDPTIIVGGSRLFREGLYWLLANTPFAAIAAAASVADCAPPAEAAPRLVLLGLASDDATSAQAIEQARRRFAHSRVVALVSRPDHNHFKACLAAGVDGYLLTDVSREVLLESLRLVILGEKVFPTILATWIVGERPAVAATPGVGKPLSPRERQILELLVAGETNKQIAARLNIADATVKLHLRKLLRKLNVANRTQAAIWAMNHGVPAPGAAARPGPAARSEPPVPAARRSDAAS